ncbi:cadherin-like beta sandwich domain-containing protein [Pelagibacterium sp. H642]|uniref:cadherin-like beta sandwich domain-containing protein n=1 Tax=Pelagibacterium sp. H642 TaxID=1881069 RepID=UPI002814CF43|nr:cadherin-like beta sandwich domain-containing protein [Pelagibacterium sp. H642]WMT92720.1 cadherin-like beta sandwich domain-containing protein [Pelagibacterium sp. H642]
MTNISRIANLTRRVGSFFTFLTALALLTIFSLLAGTSPVLAQSPLCSSEGANADKFYEWVSRLQVGPNSVAIPVVGFYDTSGSNIASLEAGSSATVEVDVHTDGQPYTEYVKVWLDLNQDGEIDSVNELVYDSGGVEFSTFRTFSGALTIPSSAYNGTMYGRMIMQYNGSPNLCGTYEYGATVDFRVNVSGGVDNPNAPQPPENVSATAGDGHAVISFDAPTSGPAPISYIVTSSPGDIEIEGAGSPITVPGLTNGTSYTFTVVSKLNATTFSGQSAPSNAVTPSAGPSSNANLAALAPSTGSLNPTFTAGTSNYTMEVGNEITELAFTPTADDGTATVTINGQAVESGSISHNIDLDVGTNTVSIVVTAQDGSTKTYHVAVDRAESSNANLAGLTPSTGTLNPNFSTGTTAYTLAVGNDVTTISFTPNVDEDNATVTVDGQATASGSASHDIDLDVGTNTVTIIVSAQDGSTKTYHVAVDRAESSNANLAGLTPSTGTLNPNFAAGTTAYTLDVGNDVATISFTPTVDDDTASVSINGQALASGSASQAIDLDVGANTVTVLTTAQDGTTKIYEVTVTRAESSNADLAGLAPSAGTLSPEFAADTTSYTLAVGNDVTTISFTPIVDDDTATVNINGQALASGSSSQAIDLDVGANTVTVLVTAQDGTTKAYTVTVTRAASHNSDLAGLSASVGSLSPDFDTGTFAYSVDVGNDVTEMAFIPTVEQTTASVTVNGQAVTSGSTSQNIGLDVGANTVTIVVTAQDESTQTYTVTVTRAASDNSNLSGLAASQGAVSPGFSPGTFAYAIDVGNDITEIVFTPTAEETSASVTINGQSVTSGAASQDVALDVGANLVAIVVTAEDGSTQTYTVTVTRAASANSDLAGLTVSDGTLAPAFAASTFAYTVAVGNDVTEINFTPTVDDGTASVTVNGQAVASDATSQNVRLDVGTNTVTIVVTAEDGSTQTYTVKIDRAESSNADLSALAASQGTLEPAFSAATTAYSLRVNNNVTEIAFTPTLDDETATVNVGGELVASGAQSQDIRLDIGANTVAIVTRAQDGTSRTYTVAVTRAEELVFDPAPGELSEAMAGEDYTADISIVGTSEDLLFSLVDGELPEGMVVNASTGQLTARPLAKDAEGEYTFTISVHDGSGNSATAEYTLVVAKRAVTVADKEQDVPEGETPKNVDLTEDATGGPFVKADIVEVTPSNAGIAEIVHGQYAQASGPTELQFYLKFRPNPGYSGEVKVDFQLTSALGQSNVGSVFYNLTYDPQEVAREIDREVRGFVQARMNLLMSNINVPSLLERRRLQAGGAPIQSDLTPNGNGFELSFATSTAQINTAINAADGLAHIEPDPFNIWIDGKVLAFNREDDTHRWGTFALLSVGADYLLNDKALVGLSFNYDRMRDPMGNDTFLSGSGWHVGPYASFEIGDGVFWDTNLLVGGSSNTIDTEFWDGAFDTSRLLLDSSISGVWQLDELTTLTPRLRAVYINETVHNYEVENGLGAIIGSGGFTIEQFRASFGAELARSFALEGGTVFTPWLGLTGGVSALDGSSAFAQVSTGASLTTPNALTIDLGLSYSNSASGTEALGARFGFGGRF